MILYLIQVHHLPEQVDRLIRMLASPDDRFVVNIDPGSNFDPRSLLAAFEGSGIRVHARYGTPVNWGGISQVYGWLDAFQFALNCADDWRFLVNLSGECLPLAPRQRIADYLQAQQAAGKRVHLSFFGEAASPTLHHLTRFGEDIPMDATCDDIRLYDRIPTLMQRAVAGVFADRSRNPVFNWNLRGSVHVTDLMMARRLVIRRLFPLEARLRTESVRSRPIRGGRAWYMLQRDAVSDILADPYTPELVAGLQNYLCPDELFLQTLVTHASCFRPEEIASDNRRFRHGDPVEIDDSMIGEVLDSDAFFARKVRYDRCPRILDHLRAMSPA
ncbi:beta-1,6-N-acetylglucosaminyltransferase [Stella sp.]|uniref:beta-1,6-N-acetylglucosaminyltransferase n=1 Tax=Stella sp. TaxID=2912054 RepID=UPI0035AF9C06